jgi:predicted nucleic acid-binding protein
VIAYLDASVLMRLVLGQPGRLREWKSIEEGVSSVIAEVECLRTLDRLHHRGDVGDRDVGPRREAIYKLLNEFTLVDVSRVVLGRAGEPLAVPLGTLDAIHLATALTWRDKIGADMTFATHDAALAAAARAMGFQVVGAG